MATLSLHPDDSTSDQLLADTIAVYDLAGPQAAELYLAAAAVGVTRPEFDQAYLTCHDPAAYITARRSGASHALIFDERPPVIDLDTYIRALATGTTPAELAEIAAVTHGVEIRSYVRARRAGATHTQATQAASRGINLYDYYAGHLEHITHKEMLGADRAGLTVFGYTWIRSSGATHQEALAAHHASIDLSEYVDARLAGLDHEAYLTRRAAGTTHAAILADLAP
jgi:hypothetical protein